MLQEYPEFLLDIRNESRNKAGQHGIWDFYSFYGGRRITFSGIIMAGMHAELIGYQEKIRTVLALPAQPVQGSDDGYVTLSWTDVNAIEWQTSVKLITDVQFSRVIGNTLRCSFLIQLKAENPYLTSVTEFETSQLRGWRGGAMLLPQNLGSKINLKYSKLINIYQQGTADAPVEVRLYGSGTNMKATRLVETYSNASIISDFGDEWSGGTEDINIFQTSERARRLTSTAGVQEVMTYTSSFDLSTQDFITFFFYVSDITKIASGDYLVGNNYIKFKDNAGVDEFVLEFSAGNETIKNGWNYFIALKQEFKVLGAPSWQNISEIEFSIKAKTGEDLYVVFDLLRLADISFTEQKLELATTLADNEYVDFNAETGAITKDDGTDMSSYLTSDSQWFYLSAKQNLILCESEDANPNITYKHPYTLENPVVDDTLLAFYPFDEGSGSSVSDAVGANDGTLEDGCVFIPTGLGHGIAFNGSGQNINFLNNLSFDLGTFTIMYWIKPYNIGSRMDCLSKGGEHFITSIKATGEPNIWVYDGTARELSGSTVLDNTKFWHVAYVYDKANARYEVYVNGILDNSIDPSAYGLLQYNTDNLIFGAFKTSDTSNGFDGVVDELKIYAGALSPDDIWERYLNPDYLKYKNQIDLSWRITQL